MLKKSKMTKKILAAAVMTGLLTGGFMGTGYAADGPVQQIIGVDYSGHLLLDPTGKGQKPYLSVITVDEIVAKGLTPEVIGGVIDIVGESPIIVTPSTEEGKKTYTIGVTAGQIASDNKGLVNGGTVFTEVRVGADGNYILENNTTSQNLVALDEAVGDVEERLDAGIITFNGNSGTSGAIGLGGTLNIKGDTTGNIITAGADGEITISLSDTLTLEGLTVTGDTNLNNLTVTGTTSLKNTTVDGTLSVTGDTNIGGDTTIDGSTIINKNLTVNGDTNLKNVTATTVKVGDAITINNDGIDMGGKKITNIKDGSEPGDAVSYRQLEAVAGNVDQLGNRVNNIDNRLDKVGAGAAALAALHPTDFDADDKLDFAAGWGHYHGKDAMALGAFYRPDERVMFSIGGAFGNGENMINAGVSFKLDKTRGSFRQITSKAELVNKVTKLEADNQELRQQLAELSAKLDALTAAK